MKLELYTVDKTYFDVLRTVDKKVPFVKENRPFLGMVLRVNDKNYFVPLASPKEKHKQMNNQIDIIKIQNGELGVINFNNMIPIPISKCNKIEVTSLPDIKYQKLLKKQLNWCNRHQKEILASAQTLYQNIYYSGYVNLNLRSRCCDFKRLEEKCREYMMSNLLHEDEFYYQVS